MRRLTPALVGFVTALALVAGLLWAGVAGALPGVRLAVDWPPLAGPGIVRRPPLDTDSDVQSLLVPDGAVSVERFTIRRPGSAVEVWAEEYAGGRSLGRPFEVDALEPPDGGDLALALLEAPDGLQVSFRGGATGWHGLVDPPVDLPRSVGMSGTFHATPTGVAAGDEVPLLWLVRNAGSSADALPDSFLADPVAGVRDAEASFAAYDYALVIWCRFTR